jgi:hypothetical protein
MTVDAEISYPAFAFVFSGRSVVVVHDRDFFATATPSQLRAGFYATPFVVIDSALVRWDVIEAEELQQGLLATVARTVGNRPIRIKLQGRKTGGVALGELKASLNRAILDDPTGLWTGGEESPEELVERIQTADTLLEVLAQLDWRGPS